MSSLLPPDALASLDDSLSLPFASLEALKAVKSVDVEGIIKQLSVAAESNRNLRSLVASVLPEAAWQSREELDALLAEIPNISAARSRLLGLAMELECGSIVHRRAVRVEELNQLRQQAIIELESQAELGKQPSVLPGPEADHWIEWACGLKEPEDAASLQALRTGFAILDDFVANLEPGMWVAKTGAGAPLSNGAELGNPAQDVREQLRHRLLALARELESGNILHHRALRVNQLNRLREEAISELRSRAESEAGSPTLPGPEADQWIKWACGLREPEDAEALATLRDSFAHLDDFVANLELDMWVAGKSPLAEAPPQREKSVDKVSSQKQRRAKTGNSDDPALSASPITVTLKAATSPEQGGESRVPNVPDRLAQSMIESKTLTPSHELASRAKDEAQRPASPETGTTPAISFEITTGVGDARGKKWWMVIAIAAFAVLTAYGAIEWSSHRNPTLPAKVAENDLTHSSANQGLDQSEMSSDSGTHAAGQPLLTRSEFRPQDRGVVRTVPTTLSASQAGTQGGGAMSQPAIRASNDVAGVYKATASLGGATQTPGPVPSGLQNTPPNNTTSVLKDNSAAQSTLAAQKPRISAGGAQGLVIRPVAPLYPASARQAHIEGTVVLQAVIGKDGNVQTVRVVSGHPMLIQAAVNAAKQWHFNPYYQDGEPVEADTQINVNFTLQAD